MKNLLFLSVVLAAAVHLSAQNEMIADSIPLPPASNIKMSGDFMLDMNLLMPSKLPSFGMKTDLLGPDAAKDYIRFLLPSRMTFSKFHISASPYPYGYGTEGFFLSPAFLQAATFKLNDRMQLSTYGQYTWDGRQIPNPGALPWEKNNFTGGIELKSNNGFGIRIEVRKGRDPAYPH
ncbi:MAG: occludin [Mediterranea sp.]|jgi:hypothetical protein|nr:occludin [Mediterranea sp.]